MELNLDCLQFWLKIFSVVNFSLTASSAHAPTRTHTHPHALTHPPVLTHTITLSLQNDGTCSNRGGFDLRQFPTNRLEKNYWPQKLTMPEINNNDNNSKDDYSYNINRNSRISDNTNNNNSNSVTPSMINNFLWKKSVWNWGPFIWMTALFPGLCWEKNISKKYQKWQKFGRFCRFFWKRLNGNKDILMEAFS